MIYKRNKTNRLEVNELLEAMAPLSLLILLAPVIREGLNVLEMVLKIMLRVN